jgi:hypothetical protein
VTTTAGARDRLRDRQSEVLAEVMAGRVPEGFDERTTRVTGIVLRSKRRRSAVRALPLLGGVPDLPEQFERFAAQHPPAGCAHDDADAFAGWAAREQVLGPAAEGWRVREVELGRRRLAVVGRGRRRRLVVGVGRWVYDIGRGRGA